MTALAEQLSSATGEKDAAKTSLGETARKLDEVSREKREVELQQMCSGSKYVVPVPRGGDTCTLHCSTCGQRSLHEYDASRLQRLQAQIHRLV